MTTVPQPSQILVTAMAEWITLQRDAVIEFRREENRISNQQVGRERQQPGR